MPRVAGFDFWVPAEFRQVGESSFEGDDGLVRIETIQDGGFVDFAMLGPADSLWLLGPRVVAEVHGPRESVTLIVSDRVWLDDDDFGVANVRCTYASARGSLCVAAVEKSLQGAVRLERDAFALDDHGHLAFGPIPVPGSWFETGSETEELLFGGGFLEFGDRAPEAGFDLLLLPSEVGRGPISEELARRSVGMTVEACEIWGCSAWRGVSDLLAVIVFRDPLGYSWRAEYRRGRLSAEKWLKVLLSLGVSAT